MHSQVTAERRHVFGKVLGAIHGYGILELFGRKQTEHADLRLYWMKQRFQKENIAPLNKYQIVIAQLQPGQESRPHLHRVGASTFMYLAGLWGQCSARELCYRVGCSRDDGTSELKSSTLLGERNVHDILPGEIHQFCNLSKYQSCILIVTHPAIYVGKGEEDIVFCSEFS